MLANVFVLLLANVFFLLLMCSRSGSNKLSYFSFWRLATLAADVSATVLSRTIFVPWDSCHICQTFNSKIYIMHCTEEYLCSTTASICQTLKWKSIPRHTLNVMFIELKVWDPLGWETWPEHFSMFYKGFLCVKGENKSKLEILRSLVVFLFLMPLLFRGCSALQKIKV